MVRATPFKFCHKHVALFPGVGLIHFMCCGVSPPSICCIKEFDWTTIPSQAESIRRYALPIEPLKKQSGAAQVSTSLFLRLQPVPFERSLYCSRCTFVFPCSFAVVAVVTVVSQLRNTFSTIVAQILALGAHGAVSSTTSSGASLMLHRGRTSLGPCVRFLWVVAVPPTAADHVTGGHKHMLSSVLDGTSDVARLLRCVSRQPMYVRRRVNST